MELYYNPERMSETEVRETFVANQWLVDEILSILKQQPKGAGVQHCLIIAPRGMGKTTVLLMLRFSILGSDLAESWQPVLFPEESYSVYDLADLWLSALNHLATETHDAELTERVSELQRTHRDSSELGEAALATIKDWRNDNKKQLLMLIDSVDIILDQIGDERDHAKLRDVLMNDGTMMLVGGATTFFKEARDYDQPLYNLFKTYDLRSLNSDQINDLLRRRAKLDGIENFEEQLKRNASRLRVLEYFTGGNPRLVMMLYRVITRSEVSEVRRGLEKLLDEVTPYYKAKIESLPAQQRKILDHIARISARTREGLTPTEIAVSVRLRVNQVSAQLKRLADIGYVRAANIRGRSSYYTLSEPLYAIWHQMRFGREVRERMNWLVTFLKGWYDAEELNSECVRLHNTFDEHIAAGRLSEARDVLEYRRYLVSALEKNSSRASTLESIILAYLQLKDVETLKRELLPDINSADLSHDTQLMLRAAGLITNDLRGLTAADGSHVDEGEAGAIVDIGIGALKRNDQPGAMTHFQRALELDPGSLKALAGVVAMQSVLGDAEAARLTIENAERHFAGNDLALLYLSTFKLALFGDFEGCAAKLEGLEGEIKVLLWHSIGLVFSLTLRFDEALKSFLIANNLEPQNSEICYDLADTLRNLNRYEEALERIDRSLQLNPDSPKARHLRGFLLIKSGNPQDALLCFDRVLERDPNQIKTWLLRGTALAELRRPEEGLQSLEKACELQPGFYDALMCRAVILTNLGRNDEAADVVLEALDVEPTSFDARYLHGFLLSQLNMHDESLEEFKTAFGASSKTHRTLWNTSAANSARFMLSLSEGEFARARKDWKRLLESAQAEGYQGQWMADASRLLTQLAERPNWKFIRELIETSNLDEPLFPLARALDYLIKEDSTLIEKLSPEVRKIVEEVVNTLKKSALSDKPAKRKKKPGRRRA